MNPARKPAWQQATALVSLSTCGAMTGFSFAHGTVEDMTSPTRMPVHLMEFKKPARPVSANDSALRSAIVNVAHYYLRMAQSKSPAEMEAVIWGRDSVDGVDHGESCAAFASLTLELGAQAAGRESWVTGGTTYPWPLHQWADVRVDPNPASPGIISVVQDAQAHQRWHPLGDGYRPQPGDWVLFDGHVEVATKYANGLLYTIGGDSLPSFTVNAHQFSNPLSAQGVAGFVNNGELVTTASQPAGTAPSVTGGPAQGQDSPGQAEIPGMPAAALAASGVRQQAGGGSRQPRQRASGARVARAGAAAGAGTAHWPGTAAGIGTVATPGAARGAGTAAGAGGASRPGTAVIPGVQLAENDVSGGSPAPAAPAYTRHHVPHAPARVPDTTTQQAFISEIAPGALAAQSRYGIPAAVTIAQAIDESGWGQSALAIRDHNLFGIKGTGPAGADMQPTQEYVNGQWVTQTAAFRVYHNVAESIADHGRLLAAGASYQHVMADRHLPDAFAAGLTGVYATDPQYGSNLITLMRLYNLYRYDATAAGPQAAAQGAVANPGAAANQSGVLDQGGVANPGGALDRAGTDGRGGAAGDGSAAGRGGATIPGLPGAYVTTPVKTAPSQDGAGTASRAPRPSGRPAPRVATRGARASGRVRTSRYVPQIPPAVTTGFITTAKAPLTRAGPLYADIASREGIRWELLAACDWMQCQAQPRYSPVHGEKLGTASSDGTVYHTRSEALAQCAGDLIELAMAVYWIDVTARRPLSVHDLASVFAAFRWGGLLKLHNISAMEFPYSVEGLTAQHVKMRWPHLKEPNAPDKPGSRFRMPFGAVPVLLSLGYKAVC